MDKVIAVFGGTFNPIHNGHVEMAKEVLRLDVVEKLIVMPTYNRLTRKPQCLLVERIGLKCAK